MATQSCTCLYYTSIIPLLYLYYISTSARFAHAECSTKLDNAPARMTAFLREPWMLSDLVNRLALPYDGRMQPALGLRIAIVLALAVAGCFHADAQATGVPLCTQTGQESPYKTRLLNAAKDLYTKGDALKMDQAKKQLTRTLCQLALPAANTKKLPTRQVCVVARHSHLRVGWTYLCDKCGKWHLNLSGGYALTSGGAVATCFHVVNPGPGMREGCLVAVDEEENVLPMWRCWRPIMIAMRASSGSPAAA